MTATCFLLGAFLGSVSTGLIVVLMTHQKIKQDLQAYKGYQPISPFPLNPPGDE